MSWTDEFGDPYDNESSGNGNWGYTGDPSELPGFSGTPDGMFFDSSTVTAPGGPLDTLPLPNVDLHDYDYNFPDGGAGGSSSASGGNGGGILDWLKKFMSQPGVAPKLIGAGAALASGFLNAPQKRQSFAGGA